ncbi:hypothetical protein NA78x_005920 [Anatilimnocola sp. NA78]|uniref:hypothetical protein n=1 Tax=Anatilimnocola sp. NA78 TaxID=3415683 RepID=UPI003CE47664
MSDSHDRSWHRTFIFTTSPVSPQADACRCNQTNGQQQTELNQVDVNQGPSSKVMKTPRKITEQDRKQFAELFGVTYIQGQQPSDYEILKFEESRKQQSVNNAAPAPKAAQPHVTPGQRHHAYFSDGDQLTPTVIEEKQGQSFSKYATDWEKAKSKLVSSNNEYIPIVDKDLVVIGHYGHANAEELQIPEGLVRGEGRIGNMDQALARTDVYVVLPHRTKSDSGSSYISGYTKKGYSQFLSDWEKFAVQADIEGIVITAQGLPSINGQAVPVDYSPVDLIDGAWAILRIAFKVGTKMAMKTIIKRGAKSATKTAAKKTVKKTADDIIDLVFSRGYDARMGIPEEHLPLLVAAAKETDSIAIFRANKSAAKNLIRDGSPGKPKIFQFKTDAKTGVLTAQTADDIALVKQHGYFLVEEGGIARRYQGGKVVEEFTPTPTAHWTVEKNQVIDFQSKKPIVGDYDLLGVAPMKSKGSNVAGVPDDVKSGDWTGPHVEAYKNAANQQLGHPPRVLHGAQDQYGGDAEHIGLTKDTAYAIFPDGRIHIMDNREAQQRFYDYLGRKPQGQSYPRPSGNVDVHDEVGAMRRKKQQQGR